MSRLCKRDKSQTGRIVVTSLFECERYCLRILLVLVKGPIKLEYLKTFNGIISSSLCEAANLHSFFKGANSLEDYLQEVSLYQMPCSLRCLFVTILVYCNLTNPRELCD